MLGHSAGGQMIGLLPNHHRVARLVLPQGIRLKGYGTTAVLGLGENLPARVARDWGHWCAAGGYATNAVRHQPEKDFHSQVRLPITVLHADDDDIATPANVADLLRTLPGASKQTVLLRPKDLGLRGIGHLDWFRPSHQAVWPLLARPKAAPRAERA